MRQRLEVRKAGHITLSPHPSCLPKLPFFHTLPRPIKTSKLAASFHCKPTYEPPSIVPRVEVSDPDGQTGATTGAEDTVDVVGVPASIPRAPMAAASSKLLIRAGRIIEHADAATPLQPQHRLQILMAVKVRFPPELFQTQKKYLLRQRINLIYCSRLLLLP